MVKIVFIGDAPSKLNIDPNIPFVGAKCFPTLVKWINYLKPDYYIVMNSHNLAYNDKTLLTLWKNGFKLLVLGKKAEKRINDLNLAHCCWVLPHPSGLNRKLNDKNYVKWMLEETYSYVRE